MIRQAEKRYRAFVAAGIKKKGIWKEVRGQSIFGDDIFFEKLLAHVNAHEETKEIPRRQRYVGRPALAKILVDASGSQIRKAMIDYGYSQREVPEFLGVHYSTISRRINNARNKT